MKVENLEKCESSGFSYGGHGGSKRGIISENQKEFYLNILKYRYDNILLPIYNKLLAKK